MSEGVLVRRCFGKKSFALFKKKTLKFFWVLAFKEHLSSLNVRFSKFQFEGITWHLS